MNKFLNPLQTLDLILNVNTLILLFRMLATTSQLVHLGSSTNTRTLRFYMFPSLFLCSSWSLSNCCWSNHTLLYVFFYLYPTCMELWNKCASWIQWFLHLRHSCLFVFARSIHVVFFYGLLLVMSPLLWIATVHVTEVVQPNTYQRILSYSNEYILLHFFSLYNPTSPHPSITLGSLYVLYATFIGRVIGEV